MNNWSYVGGTFLPQPVNHFPFSTGTFQQQQTSQSSDATHAASSDLQVGEFVEVSNSVTSTTPPIVRASHRSPVVIGVATSKPNSTAAVVKSQGLVFAWVVAGTQEAPLSGFYSKSVNGVHECNVVVDVQQDAFTIAATKDKELEEIIARFNALAS